jgi:DNA replication protein DnaC
MTAPTVSPALSAGLRALRLPTVLSACADAARTAEAEHWSFSRFLEELVTAELDERSRGRIERLIRGSGLPADKTFHTLDMTRFPLRVRRQLPALCDGSFVERADNVLAFGLPGRGKTHALCAVADELIRKHGYKVLFTPAYRLVQRLLVAKRGLTLERELRVLDGYDVVVLDDIGYIQQDREEMEVLFTFLADRHERRSVMISSNLVFSQWERIFKDPMTTACAIDRVVHHAIILEMAGTSYRADEALQRAAQADDETLPDQPLRPGDTTRPEGLRNEPSGH